MNECLRLLGGKFEICEGDIVEVVSGKRSILGKVKAVDNVMRAVVVSNDGHDHLIFINKNITLKVLERAKNEPSPNKD